MLAIAEQSMREVIAMIHSFAAAPRGKGLGDALGNVLDVVQRKHAQDQTGGPCLGNRFVGMCPAGQTRVPWCSARTR